MKRAILICVFLLGSIPATAQPSGFFYQFK
jgi:hypothetical protein